MGIYSPMFVCVCVCVRACARWRGLCVEQRLMLHFSIRCVYLFERVYRTSRRFGGMKRRRTRERETELCEGIKYDCRYTHTTVCVWTKSTEHTAWRPTDRLTTTALLSGVSLVKEYSALSKEAKTYDCTGRYTLSDKLSDFTVWRHIWRKNWVKYKSFDRQ